MTVELRERHLVSLVCVSLHNIRGVQIVKILSREEKERSEEVYKEEDMRGMTMTIP